MAYLVIEWLKNGEEVLNRPQLEAIGSGKVTAKFGKEEGKPVKMVFKDSMWKGNILSLHGKIFDIKNRNVILLNVVGKVDLTIK